jgi:hypothetical protein
MKTFDPAARALLKLFGKLAAVAFSLALALPDGRVPERRGLPLRAA